jgi:hypothetical protein
VGIGGPVMLPTGHCSSQSVRGGRRVPPHPTRAAPPDYLLLSSVSIVETIDAFTVSTFLVNDESA